MYNSSREPTLRERIRAFQQKYKLENDDLILILISSLEKELTEFSTLKGNLRTSFSDRLEDFRGLLNDLKVHFSPENLREIEGELTRLIELAQELEQIPEVVKFYFQEKFKIPEETLERIAEKVFDEYVREFRKREIWILISVFGFLIISGIFLFSWGRLEGKSEILKTVQGIERWAETSEGQALRELGRLNPHLLDCAGQGLEKLRIGNKTICKPVGGSRGWILP